MSKQSVWMAFFFAICCVVVIVLAACVVNSETAPAETQNVDITLNTDNAAQMHKYGLPTKSDVMAYHMYGRWGWMDDGESHMYSELPGNSGTWDELYGIDPDNPAFDK